jgi:hypothetical protein
MRRGRATKKDFPPTYTTPSEHRCLPPDKSMANDKKEDWWVWLMGTTAAQRAARDAEIAKLQEASQNLGSSPSDREAQERIDEQIRQVRRDAELRVAVGMVLFFSLVGAIVLGPFLLLGWIGASVGMSPIWVARLGSTALLGVAVALLWRAHAKATRAARTAGFASRFEHSAATTDDDRLSSSGEFIGGAFLVLLFLGSWGGQFTKADMDPGMALFMLCAGTLVASLFVGLLLALVVGPFEKAWVKRLRARAKPPASPQPEPTTRPRRPPPSRGAQ